jgi:hypothetical protein
MGYVRPRCRDGQDEKDRKEKERNSLKGDSAQGHFCFFIPQCMAIFLKPSNYKKDHFYLQPFSIHFLTPPAGHEKDTAHSLHGHANGLPREGK